MGDTILTYPAVQSLKRLYPESHLTILVSENLIDLWKTFPYVDEIITFGRRSGPGRLWEDLNLGQSLKERGFDLAVILPRSFRSMFQVWLSRVPLRVGYRSGVHSALLTRAIDRTEEVLRVHRIFYYLKLIEHLGKTENISSPQVHLREEDRRWAEGILATRGAVDGRPLIGINPGATYGAAKCWFPDRFAALAARLSEKLQASVFVFGKEEERPVAEEVLRSVKENGIDFVGKTRLLQLAALLERCHVLVTNDTGTMHLAAAVGTPVVALFGSTPPEMTGPCGSKHRVICKNVECSPCMKRICPTDHRCMDRITVEEVEEAVARTLRERRTPG